MKSTMQRAVQGRLPSALRRARRLLYLGAVAVLIGTVAAPARGEARDQSSAPPGASIEMAGSETGDDSVDGLIVKYRPSAGVRGLEALARPERLAALSRAAGRPVSFGAAVSEAAFAVRLAGRLPIAQAQQAADRIAMLPDVEYAVPDRILRADVTPNDPQLGSQWHFTDTYGVRMLQAWDVTTGSPGVVVAVVDTGALYGHPDLAGRLLPGYDMIAEDAPNNFFKANDGNGRDSDASDPGDWVTAAQSNTVAGCSIASGYGQLTSSWHGTHVAGTIGAVSNNGVGVAGVNWNARVLPVRVLGKCGGRTSDIQAGILWAAGASVPGAPANPNPARIVNLSLGGPGTCDASWQDTFNQTSTRNVIVVASAGNVNTNAGGFAPGNCSPRVITVAATDQAGNRSMWPSGCTSASGCGSNFGSAVSLSAPGTGVWSTLNNGTTAPGTMAYQPYDGTSMAAPHVAGVISLVWSVRPEISRGDISSLYLAGSTAFPASSSCNTSICGAGILNADAMVANIYVDPGTTLPERGTPAGPFRTFGAAYTYAYRMGRLTLKPGTYAAPTTLDKAIQIGSWGGGVVVLDP